MTEKQKAVIREYRREGYGYKKIGQLTGISENTVKTFCRRNGLGGSNNRMKETTAVDTCKNCGAPIKQVRGKKQKKFCSDKCRNWWWNEHLSLVNRKANYKMICQTCGKAFVAYGNNHRKYCSHACYIKDRFGGDNRE